MSDISVAAPGFDAAKLSSELALQAFYASEHDRPLFIIVNYDHEADKVSFLERLRKKLIEKGLSTRTLVFEDKNQDQFIKVYDLISEATREKSISIITDLPRQGSGISPDFLFYINLHRDRIARQNLRFILFLHSSDSEKFINSAGDLWDFRDRTYWLERAVYTEKNTFWQHIDEKCTDIIVPEADSKEISGHIAIVKKIVEETSAPEEKASLLLDLSRWLQRKYSYDLALEAALEGIRIISDKRIRLLAVLKTNVGYTLLLKGRFHEALKYFEESLTISREIGDRNGEGTTLNNIAGIYVAWGRNGEALRVFEESLVIARELGDRQGEGVTLNNISHIYVVWGRYEDALKGYEKSLSIRREVGDIEGVGTTLNNISQIYDALGRYEDAMKALEESLSIRRSLGDRNGEGVTLNNISAIYYVWGRYEDAMKALEESLAISRELGDRQGEGVRLNNISQIYVAWGRYDEALKVLEESHAISREIGDIKNEGLACWNIGLEYERSGDLGNAIDYTRRSVEIKQELRTPDYQTSLDFLKKLEEKASRQAQSTDPSNGSDKP